MRLVEIDPMQINALRQAARRRNLNGPGLRP
jgi:hypothetical protein